MSEIVSLVAAALVADHLAATTARILAPKNTSIIIQSVESPKEIANYVPPENHIAIITIEHPHKHT